MMPIEGPILELALVSTVLIFARALNQRHDSIQMTIMQTLGLLAAGSIR